MTQRTREQLKQPFEYGSVWLRRQREIMKLPMPSPLGDQVADLLGYVYDGLYHLEDAEKFRWENDHHIEIPASKWLSSSIRGRLTLLVFLAHTMGVQVEVRPRNDRRLTLMFWWSEIDGRVQQPQLEEALDLFRRTYGFLERRPMEVPSL